MDAEKYGAKGCCGAMTFSKRTMGLLVMSESPTSESLSPELYELSGASDKAFQGVLPWSAGHERLVPPVPETRTIPEIRDNPRFPELTCDLCLTITARGSALFGKPSLCSSQGTPLSSFWCCLLMFGTLARKYACSFRSCRVIAEPVHFCHTFAWYIIFRGE